VVWCGYECSRYKYRNFKLGFITFKARSFSVYISQLNSLIQKRTLCIAELTHCVTRCATRARPSAQRRANCLMWCDIGGRGVAAASGPEVRLRDGDALLNTYPVFYPYLKLRLRNVRLYLNYLQGETYTRIASDLRWMCDPTHYLSWMSVQTIRRIRFAYREYSLFGVGETWYRWQWISQRDHNSL
jgi:hypothetical protein